MKHNSKRFLSLLLALVMVIGLMPMSHAHAEDATLQMISEQVTSVEENANYVIALAGTKKALTNGDGRTDWGHHTMLLSDFGVCADATNLWTLESAEGGFKLKNANGYLAISRNAGSLDENGHVFELVYQEGQGWTIKSLKSNEYCNNLGGYNSSIGGWSGDGTKFDLYSVVEVAAEEADPFGKLRGLWTKVSVDTETVYNEVEGLFEYAFDNNPTTRWHSNWQGAQDKLDGSNAFAGVIDFGAAYTISQFSFTPRQDTASGMVTQASLYVRETEEAEWILVADHATFASDQTKKTMDFDAQAVRYVKFVAEQSNDGWVAVSEFDVAYFAPEHEHVYEAVVTAPTCTEGGYTTYTCACGDSYTADETEALGHTEEVIPGTPATFDGNGLTEGVRCAVCGETLTAQETIPALDYNEGIVPIDSLIATAGDWQTGYEDTEGPAGLVLDNDFSTLWHTDWYGTSRENHWIQFELTDSYTVTSLRYKPRQHGNTNGTITQYEVQVSNDGETFETVAAGRWEADRTWKIAEFEGVNAKYVRLVALDGVTDSGYVFASAAEIRLVGVPHEHVYEAVVTAPTCTEGGYTTYTCATCGDTYIADETEALGHNDGPIVVENEKPSTCTEGGYYDAVCYCTVCGVETYRSHIVVGPDGHYPTVFPGHPATCTEPGLTDGMRCGVCLEWVEPQEEIPALGHTPVAIPGYEATCTADGLTEGSYCSVCNETIVAQEAIPATGHAFGEWTETKAPTCTEDGEQSRSCANCQETETETIAKLGHSYEAVVTAPTCTEGGYTTYTCACGDTYIADETEALGHTPVAIPGYEATCTTDGMTEGSYCSVCDETIVAQVVIPATGHAFGEWTETKAPTCTEDGEQSRSCANCDAVETEVIAKLGHEHELTEEVAPTCTEGGYSVYTCVACGDSYVADETEALGHSYENGSCVRCGEADPNAVTEIANGWSGYTTWVLTSDGTLTVSPTEQLFNGKCNMANYHKINGVLTLPWSAYAEQITKVVIEEGVNAVGQMAFYELPNLREVVLADSVEEIRNYAFKNTTSLTTINLEVVEFIREGAFYGCSGLEGLTIAEGTVIEEFAFSKTPYAYLNPMIP